MSINFNSLTEEQKDKFKKLANLQQSYEFLIAQLRQTEIDQSTTNVAIEELEKIAPEEVVYKSIGGLLVKSKKNTLLDEKKSLKVTLEMRLKTLEQKKTRLESQIKTLNNSLQSDFQNNIV